MAATRIGERSADRDAGRRARQETAREAGRAAEKRFARLWAEAGRRAKEAGLTTEDVQREVEAFRAGR